MKNLAFRVTKIAFRVKKIAFHMTLLVNVNTDANGSVQHSQPHSSALIHKPWLLRTFSAPEVAEPPALAAWRGRTEILSSAGTARLTSAARATAMPRLGTDDLSGPTNLVLVPGEARIAGESIPCRRLHIVLRNTWQPTLAYCHHSWQSDFE